MKKIFIPTMITVLLLISLCRAQNPGLQNILSRNMNEYGQNFYRNVSVFQLDSNEKYKNVRDGFVIQDGQLKHVVNGNLYRQESPVILKNGTIVMTDGLINMTNGSTPLLRKNDFIDLDGNIRPLQKQTNYY